MTVMLKHFTLLSFVLMRLMYILTFLLEQMGVSYTYRIPFIGSFKDLTKLYMLWYSVHITDSITMTGVGPGSVKPDKRKTMIAEMGTRVG